MVRDVLVVGAGPVGLAVALGLVRAGRTVLVVEKEPGTAERSRAPVIWPRTQEVLDALGVLERFLTEGISLPELRVHDADRDRTLLRLPLTELAGETEHPRLLVLPQSDTERLLLEAVRAYPEAEVRFATEALDLEQDAAGVRLRCRGPGEEEQTFEARYLAGCDGAHSAVREAIGGELRGETYDVEAALADVELHPDADLPFPRFSTRGGPKIGIRIDERTWRLILPFAAGDRTEVDERVPGAVRALFPGRGYDLVWSSRFRLHRRVSTRFALGRVVLAGDAAHLNSPVGGQGMNAGIQDAEALWPDLLAALVDDTPEILETYADRRRREIERGVNRFTNILTRLLLAGDGRFVRPVFILTGLALRLPPFRRRVLRRLAMLDA